MDNILDKVTNPRLRAMLLLCQKKQPGFNIKFKERSLLMKILYYVGFVWLFNPKFMTRYWTTVGATVYAPTEAEFYGDPEAATDVLAHELVHMIDRQKNGFLKHDLPYALPQVLAALALLSIFGFWVPWLFVFLVFLLALAPIPSPGRTSVEMRGYSMSMAIFYWRYNQMPPDQIEWYAKQFTGPAYYFMWPFKKSTIKKLETIFGTIKSGSILTEPVFREVYEIIRLPS